MNDLKEYEYDNFRAVKKAEGSRISCSLFGGVDRFSRVFWSLLFIILIPLNLLIPFIPLWMAISKFKQKTVFIGTDVINDCKAIPANKTERTIIIIGGFIWLAIFFSGLCLWIYAFRSVL